MKDLRSDTEARLIAEQAAQWVADLSDKGDVVEQDFMEWLRQSPRHVEEFLFANSIWHEVSQLRSPKFDVNVLVARALAEAGQSNVVAMPNAPVGSTEHADPAVHRQQRHRRGLGGLAASVLLILAVAISVSLGLRDPAYSTAVGEQRSIALADGSVIHLNTSSRVEVHYSRQERTVHLVEGEALFSVQPDAARPFVVNVEYMQARALGTEFNVYRRANGTEVAVRSGKVQITRAAHSKVRAPDEPPTLLTAGQAAHIEEGGRTSKTEADMDVALAWRDRRLVFVGEPLESVATEFNRYNRRQIEVQGTSARQKLLSGTFRADDPESLLLFLRGLDDLTVASAGDRDVVRARHE
jgi:transmembrane sensor